MILGFSDLQRAHKEGLIKFDPDIDPDKQIAEASIDLRLGRKITTQVARKDVTVWPAKGFDPSQFVQHHELTSQPGHNPTLKIAPHEYLIAFTHEEITVPLNLLAFVEGKSSIARAGLIVHCTAPLINPGFKGRIALELCNHGVWDLEFEAERDLICQVIFCRIDSPVPSDFVAERGTYINQAVPFPSRSKK